MLGKHYHITKYAIALLGVAIAPICMVKTSASAAELPTLHLRKTATPPPLVQRLQDPNTASAWYPSSPTWFGCGGKTGDRNHTEVLATYDDTALYLAFLNIDRSTALCPRNTIKPLNTVDSNGIWIETPAKRRFYFLASLDISYPAKPMQASGEFPAYDPSVDALKGWSHNGWFAGNMTMQQTICIPWSTMNMSAPAPGTTFRVNLLNYNQTVSGSTQSVTPAKWAPGAANYPTQWGTFDLDEAAFTPPSVSPEAVLTLRPATGTGAEITLRAGNAADLTNEWKDEAVTQSNWNDWDPVDYTIKEFAQYDLSMIPKGRTIVSAVLRNHYRGNFNANSRDGYLHVVRLDTTYDPKTVTMMTSPAPVENGSSRLVCVSEGGKWIDFDVTAAVSTVLAQGKSKVALALAGSSGDTNNGKIWDISYGRADWYNGYRPRLIITFGDPTRVFSAPVTVGSLNCTSVATASSKNKLTNGTFQYGAVEGIANTTYWMDPGYAYVNGQNIPYLVRAGDVNPNTGHTALRFMIPISWRSITQYAMGIVGGHTYTFSGWYKGSASGLKADVRLNFKDSSGTSLGSGQAVYSGSGNWEQVRLTRTAPAGTAYCQVDAYNWNSGAGAYMLYSDFQIEEGTKPTVYSETMGVYYPDYPRKDGAAVSSNTPQGTVGITGE